MFVVCHILQSLDGKITGSFFSSEKTMNAAGKYGQLRSYYGCEATLYGTNTMAEFIGANDHLTTINRSYRRSSLIMAIPAEQLLKTDGR